MGHAKAKTKWVPPAILPPNPKWQQRALYHLKPIKNMDYLLARGMNHQTIKEFHIGYNPNNVSDHPSLWGLDGKTVFVSQGIVIPRFADNQIWGLKIRRSGKPKYSSPRGGKTCLYIKGDNPHVLLLCEGEFDMMIAWQEVGHKVSVGTFGGMTYTPKGRWLDMLNSFDRVIIAFDMDNDVYKTRLHQMLRNSVILSFDQKDINDYYLAGGDLDTLIGDLL